MGIFYVRFHLTPCFFIHTFKSVCWDKWGVKLTFQAVYIINFRRKKKVAPPTPPSPANKETNKPKRRYWEPSQKNTILAAFSPSAPPPFFPSLQYYTKDTKDTKPKRRFYTPSSPSLPSLHSPFSPPSHALKKTTNLREGYVPPSLPSLPSPLFPCPLV